MTSVPAQAHRRCDRHHTGADLGNAESPGARGSWRDRCHARFAHRCRAADEKNASRPRARHQADRAGRHPHGRGDRRAATKMERRCSPLGRQCALFAESPAIKRRQARQRIAEERSRQALVLAQLFAAITLSQCQRIGPKTRRERRKRNVGKQSSHFSLPRLTSHAAALGHASTLAKRRRSPVAIGTKSGRQRRATPLFFVSRWTLVEEHRSGRRVHVFRQLGCAAMRLKGCGRKTDSPSSFETRTPVRAGRRHLACAAAQHEMAFAAFHRSYDPSNIPHEGAPRER